MSNRSTRVTVGWSPVLIWCTMSVRPRSPFPAANRPWQQQGHLQLLALLLVHDEMLHHPVYHPVDLVCPMSSGSQIFAFLLDKLSAMAMTCSPSISIGCDPGLASQIFVSGFTSATPPTGHSPIGPGPASTITVPLCSWLRRSLSLGSQYGAPVSVVSQLVTHRSIAPMWSTPQIDLPII